MKQLTILLVVTTLFVFFSFSCSEERTAANQTAVDSLSVQPKVRDSVVVQEVIDTPSVPSSHFVKMAAFLDSCNFTHDTSRAKKVGYYKRWIGGNPIFLKNEFPFYKFKSHPLQRFLEGYVKSVSLDSSKMMDNINHLKNFKHVKNITGYFFRDKVATFKDLTTDGFLEEWEFENPEAAEKAAHSINDSRWSVYINCVYWAFRQDKYVYIFSSRSDWDGRKLDRIFIKLFQKRTFDPNAILTKQ